MLTNPNKGRDVRWEFWSWGRVDSVKDYNEGGVSHSMLVLRRMSSMEQVMEVCMYSNAVFATKNSQLKKQYFFPLCAALRRRPLKGSIDAIPDGQSQTKMWHISH